MGNAKKMMNSMFVDVGAMVSPVDLFSNDVDACCVTSTPAQSTRQINTKLM
jgi:hypothetical protein